MKNIWSEVLEVFEKGDINRIEKSIEKLTPYLKVCSNDYYKKSINYNLSIPFEEFYSNAMFFVWRGLEDFDKNRNLNLKNVILYRLRLSEISTWRQYQNNEKSLNQNFKNYNSAKWEELNLEIKSDDKIDDLIFEEIFLKAIDNYIQLDPLGAQVILLLSLGFSSKESFLKVYKKDFYQSSDRKKMERIKKKFKKFLNKEL